LAKFALIIPTDLREALKSTASKEVKQRLEKVLESLNPPFTQGAKLRGLRAVEALEHIGTADAKTLLQELAKGAPGALETQVAAPVTFWVVPSEKIPVAASCPLVPRAIGCSGGGCGGRAGGCVRPRHGSDRGP